MATSTIKSNIQPRIQVLDWGTYSSGSQGTDYTLKTDLIPKSLLHVQFGVGGRYQHFCFVPDSYDDVTPIIFSVPGEAHYFRLIFKAANKINFYTDSSYDMKIAWQYPLIKGV